MPESTMFGVGSPEEKEIVPEVFLSENVGEGKKYANEQEALTALAKKAIHADTFIETLKAEKHTLQESYDALKIKAATTEDIMSQLSSSSSTPTPPDPEPTHASSLTKEDVVKLLEEEKNKWTYEDERKKKDKAVRAKLLDTFKDEGAMQAALYNFVGEDEEKKRLVVELGHSDPDALVRLLKPEKKVETFTPTGTSQSRSFVPTANTGLTWSMAKEVKRKTPNKFNSLNFQREIAEAASSNPNFYNS